MSHKGLLMSGSTEWWGVDEAPRLPAGVELSLVIDTVKAISSPWAIDPRSSSSVQAVPTTVIAIIKTLEIVPLGTATIILTLLTKHVEYEKLI